MAKQTDNDPPPAKPGRKSTTLWICITFFVSAWMFVLGVLVGRGTAPVHFDVESLQKELAALREAVKKKEQEWYQNRSEAVRETPNLEFHEALKKTRVEPQLALEAGRSERHAVTPRKLPVLVDPKPAAAPAEPAAAPADRPPASAGAAKPGDFAVQVAALKEAGSADAKVTELTRKGYPAYRISGTVPGRGTWYRVRVGNFPSKAEALRMLEKLKKDKIGGIVVQK